MPPALAVSSAVSCVGSSLLQQAANQNAMNNGLAQYQSNDLSSLLGTSLQNAAPRMSNSWYHREQAERAAKDGDKVIDRIAFWAEFPIIGAWMVRKLAEKLDRISDDAERWIAAGI